MALLQPGVEVTVIDESQYAQAAGGTVPLVVIATRENKLNTSGEVAYGTIKDAANKLMLFAGKNSALEAFGTPAFRSVSGTPIHGDETNEYGVDALMRAMDYSSTAYAIRADIDLSQLEPTSVEPFELPEDGTYWMDLTTTRIGLFSWNTVLGVWEPKNYFTLNDKPGTGNVQPVANGIANPKDTFGVNGDFAIVSSVNPVIMYEKVGGTWVMLGAEAHPRDFQFAPHTRVPVLRGNGDPLEHGDTYVKTTIPNGGTTFDVSIFDENTSSFITRSAPLYMQNDNATEFYNGEPVAGDVYIQIDNEGKLNNFYNYNPIFPQTSDGVAAFTPRRHNGESHNIATSKIDVPTIDLNNYPILQVKINGVTVTLDISVSKRGDQLMVDDIVTYLQTIPQLAEMGIRVELFNESRIRIIHTRGLDITVQNIGEVNTDWTPNTMTDVAAVLGFSYSTANGFVQYRKSNWEVLSFEASEVAPTRETTVGTLWYNTDLKAEVLQAVFDSSDNKMKWVNYAWSGDDGSNGLPARMYVRSVRPASAVDGDIWIDSSDLDNYPLTYKRIANQWVRLDNTDQTTTNGMVFGSYSPFAPFDENGGERDTSSIDPDITPNPQFYPEGILLFNMDYSTYNVKEYQGNGIWRSVSGNKPDGSPYMGRHAQHTIVAQAMNETVNSVKALRSSVRFFNLMICPNYPEVTPNLLVLNKARKETAFVIGSTPMSLKPDGNSVNNWANNLNNSPINGEDGLILGDYMTGIWAFAGLTTSMSGQTIAIPAETMALTTILNSDNQSYVWYAPAGYSRGGVAGVTSIGHVENGEFIPVEFDEALGDVLYPNNINPIQNFPGEGIYVFGQKTRSPVASSLDRINVARLVAYLRYNLPRITRPFLFEPNDDQTREAVKAVVEGFLSDIVQKRGITDFAVDMSGNTPAVIDRNEMEISVSIVATRSLEFLYIPIRLKNTGEI